MSLICRILSCPDMAHSRNLAHKVHLHYKKHKRLMLSSLDLITDKIIKRMKFPDKQFGKIKKHKLHLIRSLVFIHSFSF